MHIEFWWKNQKERDLGRPRCKWENIVKLDLREIGWNGMDWIHLSQDRDSWRVVVNMVMKLQIP
jgi:hypothetical protein